jgi:hypothetical protein
MMATVALKKMATVALKNSVSQDFPYLGGFYAIHPSLFNWVCSAALRWSLLVWASR